MSYYWLCCGSTDPGHVGVSRPDCFNPLRSKWVPEGWAPEPAKREGSSFIATLPAGYENALMALAPHNVIILAHPILPVLYLDAATSRWKQLATHVSEVA
jgi:hypothetical protein